jgi:arylsulfatase A-like enzyme
MFLDAVTPRPKTTPSMVSLLTGHYPYVHGIRANFKPLPAVELEIDPSSPLHPRADTPGTLAERLRGEGYRTAAFVSNFVLTRDRSGLQRGFEVYDDELPDSEQNRKNILERKAKATTDRALEWIAENGDEPFFVWVHYIDPHGSYDPPEDVLRDIQSMEVTGVPPSAGPKVPLAAADLQEVLVDRSGRRIFVARHNLLPHPDAPRDDTQFYVDAYDAEIRFMDRECGRLLEATRSRNLRDRTMVVFTADHGESLGEHSIYFEHGYLIYEPSSKIPLVVRVPELGDEMRGTQIEEQVDLLDVHATILDWLGLTPDAGLPGRSLLAAIRGGDAPESRPAFIEKAEHGFNLRAVRLSGWKLIYNFENPPAWPLRDKRELYHIATDPFEEKNLYTSDDPRARAARDELHPLLMEFVRSTAELRSFAGEEAEAVANLSEADRKRLEAMGYTNPLEQAAIPTPSSTPTEPFETRIPPDTEDPVEILRWALQDRPALRAFALAILAHAGEIDSEELFSYLAPHHPPAVRCTAAELLGELRIDGARNRLHEMLESAEGIELALSCATGLLLLGDDAAYPTLEKGLTHWNAAVRARAAHALSRVASPAFRSTLRTLEEDPEPEVRVMALRTLLLQDEPGAREALLEVIRESLEGTRSSVVRNPLAVAAGVLTLAETGAASELSTLYASLAPERAQLLQGVFFEASLWCIPGSAEGVLAQIDSIPPLTRRRILNAAASRAGEAARDVLRRSLHDEDPELRVIAAAHLLRTR